MKALLMPNFGKKNALECTNKIISKLKEFNIEICADNQYSDVLEEIQYGDLVKLIKECDFIIAIGGDGTIIHSSKYAIKEDKPLLGINVGRLGFMASLEMSELDLLSRLIDKNYTIEKRMLIECEHKTNSSTTSYFALNDIVVSNGALSKIIDLDISIDGKQLMYYRADGVIFSTPTGSTAYALSAGGPIVDPSINCISLTPICNHSLLNRTVIFSKNKEISVSHSKLNLHPIYITIDGEQGIEFNSNDKLTIKRSKYSVKLIQLRDKSFYEIISNKFNLQ